MATPANKPDPAEIELYGFTLPANVRLQMGESSMMIGNHYSTGISISGIIERLTYIGGGCVRVRLKDQARCLLVFTTGMVAEEAQQ
jgi:purine-cytosine permease-like protein